MNRAFVKEGDGWQMCHKKNESCLYADENGRCVLEKCRFYADEEEKN